MCRQKLKLNFSSVSKKLTTLGLFLVENKAETKVKAGLFTF